MDSQKQVGSGQDKRWICIGDYELKRAKMLVRADVGGGRRIDKYEPVRIVGKTYSHTKTKDG